MGAWTEYNRTAAFQSLNNIKNSSTSVNLSNYPAIQQMTNSTAGDNTTTAINSIFTPISSFWASSSVYSSWFYVILIFFTIGVVYVKSQSLHRTCIAMLFMGLLAVAPNTAGVLYIPSSALYTLYVLTGLGLLGVLYSFWVGD